MSAVWDYDYSKYKRNLSITTGYLESQSFYLSVMRDIPLEEATAFVKNNHGMKNPMVRATVRDMDTEDKELDYMPVTVFLKAVEQEDLITSPTAACYVQPSVKMSLVAKYVATQLKLRAKAKKEKNEAELVGDVALMRNKENEQRSRKINANSPSGLQPTNCIIYNPTAHSSLTTLSRAVTNGAAAMIERFLAGNRHFYNSTVVIENIVHVIRSLNMDDVARVVDKYGLVYPEPKDMLDRIYQCCKRYWGDKRKWTNITEFVTKLKPVQRAAWMYYLDLYSLKELNPEFVRNMIHDLTRLDVEAEIDDLAAYNKQMDGDSLMHVLVMAYEAIGNKNYEHEKKNGNTSVMLKVAGIDKHFNDALATYNDFIQTFWLSTSLPSGVYNFPESMRKAVVGSDTDSAIFTTQHWAKWYCGKQELTIESRSVSSLMIYFCVKIVAHSIALLERSLGVHVENIHTMIMKNEYFYPIFALTGIAKHYYAMKLIQDGIFKSKTELDIKGVQLRDSKVPESINARFLSMLTKFIENIVNNRKMSLKTLLTEISLYEKEVMGKVAKGDPEFAVVTEIKSMDTYSAPMSSVYAYYDMWNDVFAPKYGPAPAIPYQGIKVGVDLNPKTNISRWLDSIDDKAFTERMAKWLVKTGKTDLKMVNLPLENLEEKGMPVELDNVISKKRTTRELLNMFYRFMESLNVYAGEVKHHSKLISDVYDLNDATQTTEFIDDGYISEYVIANGDVYDDDENGGYVV